MQGRFVEGCAFGWPVLLRELERGIGSTPGGIWSDFIVHCQDELVIYLNGPTFEKKHRNPIVRHESGSLREALLPGSESARYQNG